MAEAEIDFGEPTEPGGALGPELVQQQRETARRRIAYVLLGILAVVLAIPWIGVTSRLITTADAKELLTATLPSVVALVGAATGFYYGGGEGPTKPS